MPRFRKHASHILIPCVFAQPTDDSSIRVGCRQCLNLSIVADDFSHRSHYSVYISVLWKLLAGKISVKKQMELKK
jgi:hypothetical protein